MNTSSCVRLSILVAVVLLYSHGASAQTAAPTQVALSQQESNVPAAAQQAQSGIERAVKKFRIGVDGGIGLDPELIMIGAHGSFGPLFRRDIHFRPGFEFGFGEVTTAFAVNLEVLFSITDSQPRMWTPYFGVGPNFGLSHRGFEEEGETETTTTTTSTGTTVTESKSRFDFGDTDFEAGLNFIVGVRRANGLFFEMKATAYGVANVRLMLGYDF